MRDIAPGPVHRDAGFQQPMDSLKIADRPPVSGSAGAGWGLDGVAVGVARCP